MVFDNGWSRLPLVQSVSIMPIYLPFPSMYTIDYDDECALYLFMVNIFGKSIFQPTAAGDWFQFYFTIMMTISYSSVTIFGRSIMVWHNTNTAIQFQKAIYKMMHTILFRSRTFCTQNSSNSIENTAVWFVLLFNIFLLPFFDCILEPLLDSDLNESQFNK